MYKLIIILLTTHLCTLLKLADVQMLIILDFSNVTSNFCKVAVFVIVNTKKFYTVVYVCNLSPYEISNI
jgi:hypothetical protein